MGCVDCGESRGDYFVYILAYNIRPENSQLNNLLQVVIIKMNRMYNINYDIDA